MAGWSPSRLPLLLPLLLLLASSRSGCSRSAARPNIVLYLADDLGVGEANQQAFESWGFPVTGSTPLPGREMATPHLERLAREGRRFSQSYAPTALCGPSRASLLTGTHVGFSPIRGNRGDQTDFALPASATTLAEVLSATGYACAALGKWGLGDAASEGAPWRHGFRYFFGQLTHFEAHVLFPKAMHEHRDGETRDVSFPENAGASERRCRHLASSGPSRCTYANDAFAERAVAWIAERGADGAPFFLYWAPTVPHAGKYMAHGRGKPTSPVPTWGDYEGRSGAQGWDGHKRGHAAMITHTLDRDVGLLLEALESSGLENDTLVVFSSDNGPHHESRYDPAWFAAAAGLSGIKRSLLEGGVRAPTIVRWPGRVPAGTISARRWALYDLALTFALLGGAAEHAATERFRSGGAVSLLDIWTGDEGRSVGEDREQPRDSLYFELCPANAEVRCVWALHDIRKEPDEVWKVLVEPADAAPRLYELVSDGAEMRDLAAAYPQRVAWALEKRAASRVPLTGSAWTGTAPPAKAQVAVGAPPARPTAAMSSPWLSAAMFIGVALVGGIWIMDVRYMWNI